MACSRCGKSHSAVQAFLLTCRECAKKWHHRCHIPPVTDEELVARIKANNAGDIANGLQGWRCTQCEPTVPAPRATPRPSIQVQGQPISRTLSLRKTSTSETRHHLLPVPFGSASASPSPPYSQPASHPQSRSSTRFTNTNKSKDNVIVIDDSDSDTSPEPPSKHSKLVSRSTSESTSRLPAVPSSSGTSLALKGIKSTSRASKSIHPLAQEEEESSDSAQKPSLPVPRFSQSRPHLSSIRNRVDRTTTNDVENVVSITTPPPLRKKLSSEATIKLREVVSSHSLSREEKEEKREDFRRRVVENEKQRRMEHKQRQQEFLRAKSEEKEHLELVTSHVVDLTLSPDRQTQDEATNFSTPLPVASTSAIHSLGHPVSPIAISAIHTAGKSLPKDLESNLAPRWFRFPPSDGDMWDRALKKKGSMPPPSTSRRKAKARKLGDARPHIYYFNATQWIDGMKRRPH